MAETLKLRVSRVFYEKQQHDGNDWATAVDGFKAQGCQLF